MQSKKSSAGKSSPGDVFSTFLETLRSGDSVETSPVLRVLRLLKVAGPQVLEKVLKLFGEDAPNLMDNLLQAAENELITIGEDPKFPGETVVSITPQGRDFLATSR
jgi:hypothetical protein